LCPEHDLLYAALLVLIVMKLHELSATIANLPKEIFLWEVSAKQKSDVGTLLLCRVYAREIV
jgi:hypothetical protein